jgi:hypothetical protein
MTTTNYTIQYTLNLPTEQNWPLIDESHDFYGGHGLSSKGDIIPIKSTHCPERILRRFYKAAENTLLNKYRQ